jgi:archaellin
MIYIHRITFWGLLVINTVLAVAVINLGAFAQQGARYTAEDGVREEQARIQADSAETKARIHGDLALAARIDHLHNLLAEKAP